MKPTLPFWLPCMWPLLAAGYVGEAALRTFGQPILEDESSEPVGPEPCWATPHEVRLELSTLRVLEFSHDQDDLPTLVVAPFALHGATLTDLAPGHSLVECLLDEGLGRVCVMECKSATSSMRYFSIDSYLADMAVAVQDLGGQVNLIGLCQGGWLSLMFAARFPRMVCSLALIGAPIDLDAAPSGLVFATRATAPSVFESLVEAGGGLILGSQMLGLWGGGAPGVETATRDLQVYRSTAEVLFDRYRDWHDRTVDLPGTFYLQVVEQIFRRNELARGEFMALGRAIDLRAVKVPLFLLAGREDEVTPWEQLLAVRGLVGTPARQIRVSVAPCSHLALFMGAHTLKREWRQLGARLRRISH
jgi:poly(3-hydroxybutyrate) depolymerase